MALLDVVCSWWEARAQRSAWDQRQRKQIKRRSVLGRAVRAVAEPFESRLLWSGDPIGSDFQVNFSYTSGEQSVPTVAVDASGNFVVAWQSYGQDGNNFGIAAQRYNAQGVALDSSFVVNTYATNIQRAPSIAMDAAGDFVIAWESLGGDGNSYGICARRFNREGQSLGNEFVVNTTTAGSQLDCDVAMDAQGNFAVTWDDGDNVYMRRYNSAGVAQGNQALVNTYTADEQAYPAIAMSANGSFVVAWANSTQFGVKDGIFAQQFTASGSPQGGEIQVNTFIDRTQQHPAVAMDGSGNFLVIWQSKVGQSPTFYYNISGQRFSSLGIALGSETQLNSTAGVDQYSSVAMDSAGNYVVTFSGSGGSSVGLRAQRFYGSGFPNGGEFRVNTSIAGNKQYPSVGMKPDGDYVVAWGDTGDVSARRFRGHAIISVVPVDAQGNAIANDALILEGGAVSIRVSRTDTLSSASRSVLLSPGGSVTPSDYFSGIFTTPLTIPAGFDSIVVTIQTVAGDGIEENSLLPESFTITAASNDPQLVVQAGIPNSASFKIADADGAVVGMRVDEQDGSAVERPTSPDPASFKLRRTGNVTQTLTVDVDITGTALLNTASSGTPNGDYTVSVPAAQGSFVRAGNNYRFTFAPGADFMDVAITPVNDNKVEGIEWVHAEMVAASLGTSAYLITGNPEWKQSRLSIIDDEVDSVRVELVNPTISEGGEVGSVKVSRRSIGLGTKALDVNFQLQGTVSASDVRVLLSNGIEVIPSGGIYTVRMASGVDEISLQLVAVDDAVAERDERLVVALSGVSGNGYVVHPTLGYQELVLVDNDRPTVTLVASDPMAGEPGNLGEFTLQRAGSLTNALQVNVAIDGSARDGVDYGLIGSVWSFAPGSEYLRIPVQPTNDGLGEATETVQLHLQPGGFYDLGSVSLQNATVTIADYQAGMTAASFDWSMPARTGVDSDNDGRPDIRNTKAYAQPGVDQTHTAPLFTVNFASTSSIASGDVISAYSWVVRDMSGSTVADNTFGLSVPYFSAQLAEGTYTAELTMTFGAGRTSTERQLVQVDDILFVAMGDSFASGEGNPEIPANNADITLFGSVGGRLSEGTWADGGIDGDDTDHQNAHRSQYAAAALQAQAMEDADPKSSVTFVFVAQTGATIAKGLVCAKKGVAEHEDQDFSVSQIQQTKNIIGDRHIDTLTISIGGNDIGFGDILQSYVLRAQRKVLWFVPAGYWGPSLDEIEKSINQGLAKLPQQFADLDHTLNTTLGINLSGDRNIILEQYPDMTRAADGSSGGEFLGDIFSGVGPSALTDLLDLFHTALTIVSLGTRIDLPLRVTPEEANQAQTKALIPLNAAVADAADRYGWSTVTQSDLFLYHGIAAGDARWFNTPLDSRYKQGGIWLKAMGAVHPNAAGHEQMQASLAQQTLLGDALPSVSLPSVIDVLEGRSATVTAIGAGRDLAYAWDLNYDGVGFSEDVTGSSAMIDVSALSYPASRGIAVRVTDKLGRVGFATSTIAVGNDSTSGRSIGEASSVNKNEPFRLNLKRLRSSDVVNYWKINWGDGSPTETLPGDWDGRSKSYASSGVYNVQVWLGDAGGEFQVTGRTVTVTDNDPFPTVSVEAVDAAAGEIGTNTGTFRFTRSGSIAGQLTVTFSIAAGAGHATIGTDYETIPVSVTFLAGESVKDLVITPRRDNQASEGAETVQLTIDPSSLYALSDLDSLQSATVTIVDGPSIDNGSIAGQVFNDVDGDGSRGSGEQVIVNRGVLLDLDGDGLADAGEPVVYSNAAGTYQFADVAPGAYSVVLLPTGGFVETTPRHVATAVNIAGIVTGVDFGTAAPANVSGRVFSDVNISGELDPNEAVLSGRRVFDDLNGNGVFDSGEPASTSDSLGRYTVTGVVPGAARIVVELPAGWTATNTNIDGAIGVHVDAGTAVINLNAGVIPSLPSIGGLTVTLPTQAGAQVVLLTANSVDFAASFVGFYRESNGQIGLQVGAGGDDLISTDADGVDGWSISFRNGLAAGVSRFYAVALDSQNNSGPAVQASTTIRGSAGTPHVTISALTPSVREGSGLYGGFDIRRTGSNSTPLTVNFNVLSGVGQAINGADYQSLPTSVTIPAYQDYARIDIATIVDAQIEAAENVQLSLNTDPGFVIDTSSAAMTILDSNPTLPIQVSSAAASNEAGGTDIILTFTQDIGTLLTPSAVQIRNATNGALVNNSLIGLDYEPAYGRAVFHVPANVAGYMYSMTLVASNLGGTGFDGNYDGIGGDNFSLNFRIRPVALQMDDHNIEANVARDGRAGLFE